MKTANYCRAMNEDIRRLMDYNGEYYACPIT